jgi:predicted metalloenzyme YecM
VFDHIGVQTHSVADYAHVKAELSAMGSYLSERFVGGRHICNLAIRPTGHVEVNASSLIVELFAPKSDQVDPEKPPCVWHIAFLLRELVEHLPMIERAGVRTTMRLTVGAKEVLFLLTDGGEEIELASLPLA